MTKISEAMMLEKLILQMKTYEGLTLKQGQIVDKALRPWMEALRDFYINKNKGVDKYGVDKEGGKSCVEGDPMFETYKAELLEYLDMQVELGEPKLDGEWFPELRVSSEIASLAERVCLIKEA